MKIYITTDGTSRNGFLTHQSLDLEGVCEDAEATEIIAYGVLNYIKFNELIPYLTMLVKKLRHGGRLTIGGTEPTELCKSFVTKSINEEELNAALYQNQRGIFSLFTVTSILENLGLTIQRKKLEGSVYLVEATRD